MIFIGFSDPAIDTGPIVAADIPGALEQLRQDYALGSKGDGTGEVRLSLFLPAAVVTIVPNPDPNLATVRVSGDAATQKTLRDNARAAIAANQTYLGIGSPTNPQVVAQVRALTQQADALIRLAVGDFSGTT